MSYQNVILKDHPLAYWKLDESDGDIAYDYSGCGNDAEYIDPIREKLLPLVSGGLTSIRITDASYINFPIFKDYYGNTSSPSFGTEKSSDNDFTLEVWIYPKNLTTPTNLFGSTNGIGIFWDEGNILFSISTENIHYTLPDPNKTIHVAAVYKKQSIFLYIDGILVRYKQIDNFTFSNPGILLSSGPCALGDSFIIDSPAVYRYALSSDQIKNHYDKSRSVTPSQIASLNQGTIFRSTEKHQSETDKFSFPRSKSWEYMMGTDLSYDEIKNSIYLSRGKSYGEFIEAISLSITKSYVSSKIEWLAGQGVSVFVSTDEENWTECENGSSIPSIGTKRIIYIKVKFESSDSEIFTPEMYYLNIFFYPEKKLYSHNGNGFIYSDNENGDIDISNIEHAVLARKNNDGIVCKNSGFKLNSLQDTSTIEFIFTPKTLSDGYILYNYTGGEEYSILLSYNGNISMSGISVLYINGENVSSFTNISDYIILNDSNHIVIKTADPISGEIVFNGKYYQEAWSQILDNNVYKNVTIYNNLDVDPETNYNLYRGLNSLEVEDSSIGISESDTFTYSPDWIRVSNA